MPLPGYTPGEDYRPVAAVSWKMLEACGYQGGRQNSAKTHAEP